MKKIFCVEDDLNIRELISYALSSSGFEVCGFENSMDFSEGLKKDNPDLILLDIMLPDKDGTEILKELKSDKAHSDIPVIVLTAKSQQLDKIRCLDGGADDYITKPFDVLELISRVNAVLRRYNTKKDDNDTIIYNEIKLIHQKRKAYVSNNEISLTYKEYELLYMFLINKGIVIQRDKIMNEIWGTDFLGETRTVDVHIRTLRQKLGDAGKYIQTVRNVGYKME